MVAVQAAAGARAPAGGERVRVAVTLREVLLAKWRDEVAGWSPSAREAWLDSTEGYVALGARRCKELLRQIRGSRKVALDCVCSADWLAAAFEHGRHFPPGVEDERGTAMVLSREATSYGAPTAGAPYPVPGMTWPRRRWTPPQAVSTEDMLDGMHPHEATFYNHPPSPSAIAIWHTVTYGPEARPPRGRTGVRREIEAAKQARENDPR